MSQIHKHDIPANIADRCLINPEQYHEKYQQSITAPDTFWGEQGHILDWIKPYQKVKNTSFAPGNVSIKWYEDGTLNGGKLSGPSPCRARERDGDYLGRR